MIRQASVLLLLLAVCAGCATQANVVDEPDQGQLEALKNYEIEEREIRFEAAGTEVYGTLTRPEGRENAPAIVFVAGSGPTDRDWNNPLLPGDNGTAIELAERLAEAGIASLRYDKRGTGHTELPGSIGWNDYLAELQQAVATVEQADGIDADRIFAAGHSEGGAHVLKAVAAERIDVDGVVLLSVPGRSMRQLVVDQVTEQLSDAGMVEEAVDAELASLNRAMDAVSAGERISSERVSDIPGIVTLVETLQQENARDFAAELLGWDPLKAVSRVDAPMLLLGGLKDMQIDVEHDKRRLYESARERNDDVELALVADADHVLKRQTLPREEIKPQHALTYNDPARVLDEAVLETLVRWVEETTGERAP